MLAALVLISGAAVSLAPAAGAEPATPVVYPSGSGATRTVGPGFDTCTAPSLAALQAWQESPFLTVNIYFGGANRGCLQPNLTSTWVRQVAQMSWRLLPTYMGFQPFCTLSSKIHRYTLSNATAVGASNARDAVAKATALGLRPGSALYADVEHYDRAVSGCITAVRRYVSAWTSTLHANGYLAGVYVHQDSGLRDLSAVYNSTSYARPDAVWMARWDNNPSLTNWPTAPNTQWSFHQRAKQYRGDHNETWGGVTLNIDSDSLDAPVATVALPYQVTSGTPLSARSGPSTSYPVVATYAPGATISVVCQTWGQQVGTSPVWDRLTNGAWVADYYVSTPSNTTYSAPLQRCSYPGQVTSSTPLNVRTGPGTSYPTTGSPLQPGALAWVMCQKAGSTVGTTSVWNRMTDGRWVTDYYVSNRSNTTYSAPVPRCG
ncbi:MAG TPA: glycoside hydrolase domain-containing protein [Jiangellaceae bacterium]